MEGKEYEVEEFMHIGSHDIPEDIGSVSQRIDNTREMAADLEELKSEIIFYYILGRINNLGPDIQSFLKGLEKAMVTVSTRITGNNIKRAAEILGVNYSTLVEKIKSLSSG